MSVEIIQIYIDTPHQRTINKAIDIVKNGGVIVYPTDTIYGLGADLFNKKAIAKILKIKKQNITKPLSFILPDLKDISKYAKVDDYAYKIMRKVTPGPYTFVLNATKELPKLMLHKRKTIGIRIPDAPYALRLVEELGHPILSTSVPLDDDESYHTDPEVIAEKYDNEIDLILDAGVLYNNASTIVDLTGDNPNILREGAGNIESLEY